MRVYVCMLYSMNLVLSALVASLGSFICTHLLVRNTLKGSSYTLLLHALISPPLHAYSWLGACFCTLTLNSCCTMDMHSNVATTPGTAHVLATNHPSVGHSQLAALLDEPGGKETVELSVCRIRPDTVDTAFTVELIRAPPATAPGSARTEGRPASVSSSPYPSARYDPRRYAHPAHRTASHHPMHVTSRPACIVASSHARHVTSRLHCFTHFLWHKLQSINFTDGNPGWRHDDLCVRVQHMKRFQHVRRYRGVRKCQHTRIETHTCENTDTCAHVGSSGPPTGSETDAGRQLAKLLDYVRSPSVNLPIEAMHMETEDQRVIKEVSNQHSHMLTHAHTHVPVRYAKHREPSLLCTCECCVYIVHVHTHNACILCISNAPFGETMPSFMCNHFGGCALISQPNLRFLYIAQTCNCHTCILVLQDGVV
jgi:hypothetical protein